MKEVEEDNRRLTFKREGITLDQWGKALKAYNKLVKLFGGRNATYSEFADWLIANGFVNVEPTLAEVEKAVPFMALGNSEPIPEDLPESLKETIRQGRREAGWCDHGNKLGECPKGCE